MKVQGDPCRNEPCCISEVVMHNAVGLKDMTEGREGQRLLYFQNSHHQDELDAGSQGSILISQSGSKYTDTECIEVTEDLCNGTSGELDSVISYCDKNDVDMTDGVTEISEDSQSLPEVYPSSAVDDDEDLTPEVRQAFRIFHSFLLEKHKALIAPFWLPIGPGDIRDGEPVANSICFKRIEEKFAKREYETITEFVADFRLMLENCYRFHGVDHWISKQAQKLEIILEQKLTLLSRTLREKTTLAVTSKGRFGAEDEKGTGGTSTRRRSVPRNLAAITVGGSESIMVQALRLEEQQRAKEEKRQRELEKKEAEEASAKEVEEWERALLSQADPWPVETMWELPAIGHFLCLAQKALNLPEIVFFELERCLLMPRCSSFLAKVMTSLLCQPHRRATLHRRPALPYRRWEAELRRRVGGWYQTVGRADDQGSRAEQLGLCQRFFCTLGETSPLEERAFHLLPFSQRVWLLKGLCDNVYETQKDVQDAVLGQPIHECRESILGYDGQENAYIHFPHFCGADLRIYCQSPCMEPEFPLPAVLVKKLERDSTAEGPEVSVETSDRHEDKPGMDHPVDWVKVENGGSSSRDSEVWRGTEDSLQDMGDLNGENEPDQKRQSNFIFHCKNDPESPKRVKEELVEGEHIQFKKEEGEESSDTEPCLRVGENCYRGKSPANSWGRGDMKSSSRPEEDCTQVDGSLGSEQDPCSDCHIRSEQNLETHPCQCTKKLVSKSPTRLPWNANSTEGEAGRVRSKKKKRKKKKGKELRVKGGPSKLGSVKLSQAKAAKSTLRKAACTIKKKDKRKKRKLGKKVDADKVVKKEKDAPQFPVEPTFKLVCSSLEELRDLISKTEDELDELESTKKRSGRWYYKREAVKELHITLIRLLNELTPWEPKLVKAFQRNRARLKKDYDDFKKHPEYDNFVREELVVEELEGGMCKEGSTDASRDTEEEEVQNGTSDMDPGVAEYPHLLENEPLGSGIRASLEILITSNESGPSTRSSKRRLIGNMGEDLSPNKRNKMSSEDSLTPEIYSEDGSKKQNVETMTLQVSEKTPGVSTPVSGFHGRCKPIQALLAKSVGNKVTLISQSQAAAMAQALQVQTKTVPTSTHEIKSVSSSQPAPLTVPITTQIQTAATTSTPKSPVQLVYKMSGGLGLFRKDGSQVKFAVQPVLDQKTGDKTMQQVVILPKNLVIQKSFEEKTAAQGTRVITVPTSKTPSSSAFTIPEKIPIQQVAPLKDTRVVRTPSPVVSPSMSKVIPLSGSSHVAKGTTDQNVTPNRSPAPSATPTDPSQCDLKQELKTVCIRDSQSILVTTRGGNTGVVKVQTSDQGASGTLPASPVFTIPPHLQAFLVSKSSSTAKSNPTAVSANTTAQSLPAATPRISRSTSLTSVPHSPSTGAIPGNAAMVARSSISLALNHPHNNSPFSVVSGANSPTTAAQTLISANSQLSPNSQNNVNAQISPVKIGQGVTLTTPPKNIIKPPSKRSQPQDKVSDQAHSQKIFVVSPSSDISAASKITTPTTLTVPGPRVVFISQAPGSTYSTVTVPKGTLSSGLATTPSTTTSSLKFGSSTPGEANKIVHEGISVPELPSKLLEVAANVNSKAVTLPETTTQTTPVSVSKVHATSSGLIFVQRNNPVSSSGSQSVNSSNQVKGSVSFEGKIMTFSTLSSGHMASSSLLTAAQQQSVPSSMSSSVSEASSNRSHQTVGSSALNVVPQYLGNLISRDTMLMRGVVVNKPRFPAPLPTGPAPVRLPTITSPLRVTHPVTLSSTTQAISTPTSTPLPITTSIVRPINPTSAATTVQEKIVINTTAPLAPGTQILINNTRLVVPAQGLGPGSHVLLITSPAVPRGVDDYCQGTFVIQWYYNAYTRLKDTTTKAPLVSAVQPAKKIISRIQALPVVTVPSGSVPTQTAVSGVSTNLNSGKLLVSPDGAVLNAVRGPAFSSFPVMAKPVAAQTVISTTSNLSVLSVQDPQQSATPDKSAGPNQ
ncbi:uncharacterized protein KIAA2026 [Chanos chanos]|uniref:Uncharacterized protein KIAA2026 n=1 Tax=Chanos chanos TaxID=29144 RepID=A0A6J2UTI6_CHACN|nr:uncharacterized protein KIAA2026 homolog [Chanos chanos]